MVAVELSAVRAGLIGKDIVFQLEAVFSIADVPCGFVDLVHRQRMMVEIPGLNAAHILGEVTDLVQGIPGGQLNVTLRHGRRNMHADV